MKNNCPETARQGYQRGRCKTCRRNQFNFMSGGTNEDWGDTLDGKMRMHFE